MQETSLLLKIDKGKYYLSLPVSSINKVAREIYWSKI